MMKAGHTLSCAANPMKPSTALNQHRSAIRHIVSAHHASNARVFGSALHGTDSESSDLDILIDPGADTTLLDIAAIAHTLEQLLGIRVDVLTPNALPAHFRRHILAQAQPI